MARQVFKICRVFCLLICDLQLEEVYKSDDDHPMRLGIC